ncbi:MAG: SDR family oxidoreductase [Aureispira sp.]|nr:SDR family oxidoreductase [Aureispira sp.]
MKLVFKNKVVWLTGAASGIGEHLAYALAQQGAKLILSDIREGKLNQVAQQCTSTHSIQLLPFDLENYKACPEKATEALAIHGTIDFLFNVAGIAQRDSVLNTDLAVDEKIMNINYFSTIAITKTILPEMIKNNKGHIVVTSSLSGKYGVPNLSAYSASKHALHGFFESLRTEIHPHNINISILIPGFINTPIINHSLTGDGSIYNKNLKVQEKGLGADICAKRILKAVAKQKKEVFIGGSEGITLPMHRLFPRFFGWFIRSHPMKKLRKLKSFFFFWRKKH